MKNLNSKEIAAIFGGKESVLKGAEGGEVEYNEDYCYESSPFRGFVSFLFDAIFIRPVVSYCGMYKETQKPKCSYVGDGDNKKYICCYDDTTKGDDYIN